MTSEEKILAAATELMAAHGFKETTTKEIAVRAGVSEMTLFRHFGDKLTLLKAIVSQPLLEYPAEKSLWGKLTWELETDLLLLSQVQMQINKLNEQSLLIKFREKERLKKLHINLRESSRGFHAFMVSYFDEMAAQGRICKTDNDKLADYFMSYNFGLYCDSLLRPNDDTEHSKEEEMKYDTACFAKGLRP